MAAKFVVAVACLAVCSSTPVQIRAVSRDKRAYSIGQAYNYDGGASVATANVVGDNAQAYGSTNGNQFARDGLVYPGQATALAQTFGAQTYGAQAYGIPENPGYGSKAIAQSQNGGYYPIPAPATVITYEQNFAVPAEVNYESPATIQAYSSAVKSGASEKSVSSVSNNGEGVAESSANTGDISHSSTSSNAKTSGRYGQADSISESGINSANSAAKSQGDASASSIANTNGIAYPVAPVAPVPIPQEFVPSVADLKTPIYKPLYKTPYVPVAPARATSNAQVVGSGTATSSAKIHHGRKISWRFGTLYDSPASAQAQASTHGSGTANSQANTYGSGIAKSQANTHNSGIAKSQANTHGSGIAKSQASTNGYGSANANANVNSLGYGAIRYTGNAYGADSANANAAVNGNGYGVAQSQANTHDGSASSTANSNTYGNAKSAANVHQGYYGASRTSADAQSHGAGSATSSARAQPVSTAYRVANSQANSSGSGYARANAQTA